MYTRAMCIKELFADSHSAAATRHGPVVQRADSTGTAPCDPSYTVLLRGISIQRSDRCGSAGAIRQQPRSSGTSQLSSGCWSWSSKNPPMKLHVMVKTAMLARHAHDHAMMGFARSQPRPRRASTKRNPDVNAHRHQSGRLCHLTLFLRQSKCDQAGRGVEVTPREVTVCASGSNTCAVQFMEDFTSR